MWHDVAIFEVSPDLVSNNTLNDLRDEGQIGDGAGHKDGDKHKEHRFN